MHMLVVVRSEEQWHLTDEPVVFLLNGLQREMNWTAAPTSARISVQPLPVTNLLRT